MRRMYIERETAETRIAVTLEVDGRGTAEADTGCGFLDHMLTLFCKHGRFDLAVKCVGDVKVDYHHTVEDCGIAIGQAFSGALQERRGIARFADCLLPMDEAAVSVAVDVCGRDYLVYDLRCPSQKVGDFDTELAREFFLGLCRAMGLTLHISLIRGENSHHILEALYKGVGVALSRALAVDPRFADDIPSTKGML